MFGDVQIDGKPSEHSALPGAGAHFLPVSERISDFTEGWVEGGEWWGRSGYILNDVAWVLPNAVRSLCQI